MDATTMMVPEPTAAFKERLQRRRTAGPAPIPHPVPIPFPLPMLGGSRFLIWKQDPTVAELGARVVFLPGKFLSGPHDARIVTELPGTTPVAPNALGDYVFPIGTPELDCAHTFAVVRATLNMAHRALHGAAVPFAWNTGGNIDPITVFPRAGVTANAFYSRSAKALKFFFFTPTGSTTTVFTCRSLDIVSHECGHAVLDGLKPGWLAGTGSSPQTGGLHESFGDLCALFLALSQLDQAEAFVAMTKGNLHAKNFLAALAEQFGAALGLPLGLRNADNDLKLSDVSTEVHAISQIFTGGIYDVLADIYRFERIRQGAVKDPAQILVEVAQDLFRLLLAGIKAAPATNAKYADVINAMLVASKAHKQPPIYRAFLRHRFIVRQVVVSPTPLTAATLAGMGKDDPNFTLGADDEGVSEADSDHPSLVPTTQDRQDCCGTMQRSEFALAEPQHLVTGKALTDDEILEVERAELRKQFNGKTARA
jgi:hypothetical protein